MLSYNKLLVLIEYLGRLYPKRKSFASRDLAILSGLKPLAGQLS